MNISDKDFRKKSYSDLKRGYRYYVIADEDYKGVKRGDVIIRCRTRTDAVNNSCLFIKSVIKEIR